MTDATYCAASLCSPDIIPGDRKTNSYSCDTPPLFHRGSTQRLINHRCRFSPLNISIRSCDKHQALQVQMVFSVFSPWSHGVRRWPRIYRQYRGNLVLQDTRTNVSICDWFRLLLLLVSFEGIVEYLWWLRCRFCVFVCSLLTVINMATLDCSSFRIRVLFVHSQRRESTFFASDSLSIDRLLWSIDLQVSIQKENGGYWGLENNILHHVFLEPSR